MSFNKFFSLNKLFCIKNEKIFTHAHCKLSKKFITMGITILRKFLYGLLISVFLSAFHSCEKAISPEADNIDAITFKTEVPFEIRQGKIVIPTDWGVYKLKDT